MSNVCLTFTDTLLQNCLKYWPWYLGYIVQGAVAQSANQAKNPYHSSLVFSNMWQRGYQEAAKGNIRVEKNND